MNGKRDSTLITYYESGQIWLKGNFTEGNGRSVQYDESGIEIAKITTKEDLTYKSVSYYDSGKLKHESNGKDGKPYKSVIYYESGTVKRKINYQQGTSIAYYESGEVMAEGIIKDNKVDGKFVEYFESGKVKVEEKLEGKKRVSELRITRVESWDGKENM